MIAEKLWDGGGFPEGAEADDAILLFLGPRNFDMI